MRALRGAVVGTVALCLAAGWALQTPGGVSLVVPQPNINATVAQNILLSVEYSCRGVATIEWKHVSSWGTASIVEWKSGNYVNISTVYKDRVTTFENGSIQLLNVGMRDAGYYFVTVTDEYGTNAYGTIIVNVYEIIYEDLHFVAVLFAFLAAASAILICFMWLCNKSLHLFQKKITHKLTEFRKSTVPETCVIYQNMVQSKDPASAPIPPQKSRRALLSEVMKRASATEEIELETIEC